MLRIVIGLTNYDGAACGLNFEKSVAQDVPADWDADQPQLQRLLLLFPGTTVEDVKRSPTIGEDDAKVRAELEAALAADSVAPLQPDEVEEVEEVVEAEAVVEDEDVEDAALAPGDKVLAHYKDEFRRGEIVKILESGVVHVRLDDDDVNYRVLDDDKVNRLDPSAADPEDEEKL